MKRFGAIVVGAGVMGSSVSRSLSKTMSVLNLERFQLNHQFGSSHGKTRVIRLAYAEDPRYVPLLRGAFANWEALEKESGTSLLTKTGGLMIGNLSGQFVGGVLESARTHGLEHKLMTGRELAQAYPLLNFGEGFSAVFDRSAGILLAEESVKAFHDSAEGQGCEFRFGEPAVKWKKNGDGVEVVTAREAYQADKLVLCAGPWTKSIGGGFLPLECERQVHLWFDSKGQDGFRSSRLPVFIAEESPGKIFYGIPDIGHGVKVAAHRGGTITEPDSVDRVVTEADVAPVAGFIDRRIPKLDPTPIGSVACTYTNTPDSNFIIDFLPGESNILLISACSGHGFKFASVIGEIASDLVTRGSSKYDIGFLGLSRFVNGRGSYPLGE